MPLTACERSAQQLVANMEASAREARAKAAASSKLKDLAPSKDVWGAEVAEDVELDEVRLLQRLGLQRLA
jgi:hypothetical protein